MVNVIKIGLGPLQKITGPVLGIANRVRLVHSFIDASGEEPVLGLRITTGTVNDTTSQARYGILEKVLSSGGVTLDDADQIRDQFMAENAQPGRSEEIALGGNATSMDLECVGLARFLETYIYTNTGTGLQNLSAKLSAVIAADPNGFILPGNIATNTLQVRVRDNDDRTAWNVIKSLIARGDASENRYTFGVYAGRLAHYAQVVEQVDYHQALSDTSQQVLTPGGSVIEPWYVLPGKWMWTTDFMVGRVQAGTTLRDDPRMTFIESVSFTAPYSLTIRGGRVSRLEHKLARLGLAGIGA